MLVPLIVPKRAALLLPACADLPPIVTGALVAESSRSSLSSKKPLLHPVSQGSNSSTRLLVAGVMPNPASHLLIAVSLPCSERPHCSC
mmetsp:Transcript_28125/g.71950  ORF Transcript_28125/g.71950 Transcript_28125/m.71950 type:complete len:88 (+) Transcript_28125:836-1099(+)